MSGPINRGAGPTLDAKVEFLSRPDSYRPRPESVERRETHMSWVFLEGDRVYKLKKPVRFSYLDFSTIDKREAACRAELRLNRRLAPDTYLEVAPLVETSHGFAIGGEGAIVDWLVVMKRINEEEMLDELIAKGRVTLARLDRLGVSLARFYRSAGPVYLSSSIHIADLRRGLSNNKHILLNARLKMPAGLVRRIDATQRRFLDRRADLLVARIRSRRIVEGHGDLRPEHIAIDGKVRIIDCLEFNRRLRMVDPIDEIAFLGLECERLGAGWIGNYLRYQLERAMRDRAPEEIFLFYHCYRATLRARLAIAHLLEESPRTPEKWPRLARIYLSLAEESAKKLDICLRKP